MNTFAAYVYLRILNIVLTDGYKRLSKPSFLGTRQESSHQTFSQDVQFGLFGRQKAQNERLEKIKQQLAFTVGNWEAWAMPVELFRRVLCLKGSADSVCLVGGFLKNPVDKYARQNGFIFQFSGWQPPSFHSPKRLNGWF